MFKTIKSWFKPKFNYEVNSRLIRFSEELKPGDKTILLVTVGNNEYPVLEQTTLDTVSKIFRAALDKTGAIDMPIVCWNHTLDARVIVLERTQSETKPLRSYMKCGGHV